jgi:hypothetical protein
MPYNFCRVHESLRSTPAMALGIADEQPQRNDGPAGAERVGIPVAAGPDVFNVEPPSRRPGATTPCALAGLGGPAEGDCSLKTVRGVITAGFVLV